MPDRPAQQNEVGDSGQSWSPEQMLTRLGGDKELARQLISLFLADYPRMIASVRESVRHGSADEVRRAAHACKGSVLNFVEGGPATTAFALEQIGQENRLAEAPAVLARLEEELNVLVGRLRRF